MGTLEGGGGYDRVRVRKVGGIWGVIEFWRER